MTLPGRTLRLLAVAGCGTAGALLSHAVFSLFESGGELGSSYAEHAHASVPLAACFGLVTLCVAGAIYVVRAIDAGNRRRVVALARDVGRGHALSTVLPIACVALAVLAAMEGYEGDVAGAFGSVPLLGAAMVAAIGAALGFALRVFARWIADFTESFAAALCLCVRRRSAAPTRCERRFATPRGTAALDVYRRVRGNRAPPALLA